MLYNTKTLLIYKRGRQVKRKIFTILAMILCVCFCFAGCNLFPENKVAKANQTVVSAGGVTITREEFIKGYNSYYSTFYNQYGNSEKATDALIKYLVAKELYLEDANKMLENGEITLSNTEQNYLWNQTLEALITNIESFENHICFANYLLPFLRCLHRLFCNFELCNDTQF